MAVKLPPKKEKAPPERMLVTIKNDKYGVHMFFNRVFIEQLDRHALLHFGLMSGHELLAQYSVVFESEAIENSRDSMLEFLGTYGAISEEIPQPWRPTRGNGAVEVSNILTMARTGEMGELRFGVYSTGMMVEHHKNNSTGHSIAADPLALLRCDVFLQNYILVQLYTKETL